MVWLFALAIKTIAGKALKTSGCKGSFRRKRGEVEMIGNKELLLAGNKSFGAIYAPPLPADAIVATRPARGA